MKIKVFKKTTLIIMTIVCLFLFSFTAACAVYTVFTNEPLYIVLLVSAIAIGPALVNLNLLRWGYYSAYVEICENGIEFISRKRKYSFKWEDISGIGLTEYTIGTKGICISLLPNASFLSSSLAIEKTTEDFIFLEFRKYAYQEIRKYWNKEIVRENIYKKKNKI